MLIFASHNLIIEGGGEGWAGDYRIVKKQVSCVRTLVEVPPPPRCSIAITRSVYPHFLAGVIACLDESPRPFVDIKYKAGHKKL